MFNTDDYTLRTVPLQFGSVTLMGMLYDEYPYPHGNYFSLMIDGSAFQVLNFYYENLQELQRQGLNDITVLILDHNHLFIQDDRISDNWYSEFTWRKPRKYWSPAEVLKDERMISSGKKEIFTINSELQGEKINANIKPKYPINE